MFSIRNVRPCFSLRCLWKSFMQKHLKGHDRQLHIPEPRSSSMVTSPTVCWRLSVTWDWITKSNFSLHSGQVRSTACTFSWWSVPLISSGSSCKGIQTNTKDIVTDTGKVTRNSSSSYILMGRYNNSVSLDATIMVSKNCPTMDEQIVTILLTK